MPSVHIKSPRLSTDQKKRIGDRVISAFHGEGFSPSSIVVFFEREEADLFLEGGLLFEVEAQRAAPERAVAPPPAPVGAPPVPEAAEPAPVAPPEPDPAPDFKSKLRRSKGELSDLKARLVKTLQLQGALSSFQAQEELGLKACDWAPATLRRFFSELEDEGVISKQGQKRGTRYVWKGTSHQPRAGAPQARLVKRSEDE
jgi:phenylpyruvate tautomerase PptA (4-oxalocrotonate tautomerase family)